jgi:hypothetical protein
VNGEAGKQPYNPSNHEHRIPHSRRAVRRIYPHRSRHARRTAADAQAARGEIRRGSSGAYRRGGGAVEARTRPLPRRAHRRAEVATAAAKTADIAAIASEVEGVGSDALTEAMPADLPRGLAQDRRAYITAGTNVAKAIPPRQRDLAARYLQTLAAFDAAAAKSKDAAVI